jgi:hypothetical protein
MNENENRERITLSIEFDEGSFLIEIDDWAQLPQAGDRIDHPDARWNSSDDRNWVVRNRIYRTRIRESDGKIEVAEIALYCEFDDHQELGLRPFSNLDPNPNPSPRPFNVPSEHAEAILDRLQELTKEAIAKNDWSDVFLFLTRRVPNWRQTND